MNHVCPKTKAAVIDGEYVEGCNACMNNTQGAADYAAKWKRDRSREDFRKDIVQRYDGDKLNPEWVKLYEAQARDEFGDAAVEDLLRNN